MKDPKEKGHLIIDEETAPIVKQIFDYAAEGHGVAYICKRLEEQKVPCPTWWNRQRGFRNGYTKWEIQDPENGKYVWDQSVMKDMLINTVYYGAISSQKRDYKFKLGVLGEKKPEDWITVEGMHEPIVDQDTFELVQEKIASRKCSRGDGTFSLFAGLIKCGECGKALTIRKTHAQNPIDIYACVTYNRYGKHHCTQHRVEFDKLYDIVFDEIRSVANESLKDKENIADEMQTALKQEQENQIEVIQKTLAKDRERLEVLDRMTSKLYEDLLAERINEETFNKLLGKSNDEMNDLKKEIISLSAKVEDTEVMENNAQKWIDLISEYADIKELDAEILNKLIRQIVVHEEIDEDGKRNISLEIHYNFRPNDDSRIYQMNTVSPREVKAPLGA